MSIHPGDFDAATSSNEPDPAYVVLDAVSGQRSLIAARSFVPGQKICSFRAAETHAIPGVHTLQTGDGTHIIMEPSFLLYTNHSCEPNLFFDTTRMIVECLRTILPGDQLTFFYPSTEWEMAEPFECRCGSAGCLKVIAGAAQLPVEVMEKYRLTPFIQSKMKEYNWGAFHHSHP